MKSPGKSLLKCHRTGKLQYATEQAALDRIQVLRIIGAVWRRERHVYRCRYCGDWHLTKM